jgi:hypothetical protein
MLLSVCLGVKRCWRGSSWAGYYTVRILSATVDRKRGEVVSIKVRLFGGRGDVAGGFNGPTFVLDDRAEFTARRGGLCRGLEVGGGQVASVDDVYRAMISGRGKNAAAHASHPRPDVPARRPPGCDDLLVAAVAAGTPRRAGAGGTKTHKVTRPCGTMPSWGKKGCRSVGCVGRRAPGQDGDLFSSFGAPDAGDVSSDSAAAPSSSAAACSGAAGHGKGCA